MILPIKFRRTCTALCPAFPAFREDHIRLESVSGAGLVPGTDGDGRRGGKRDERQTGPIGQSRRRDAAGASPANPAGAYTHSVMGKPDRRSCDCTLHSAVVSGGRSGQPLAGQTPVRKRHTYRGGVTGM